MTAKPVQLRTPLGDEVLALRAGDHVELSGVVYTARDEAHLRMQKDGIPFDPKGAVIYHCGPVIQGHAGGSCRAHDLGPDERVVGFLNRQRSAGAHRERRHGNARAGPAERQGRLPRVYRRVCGPCSGSHEIKRCFFSKISAWQKRSGCSNSTGSPL